jgi:hypothetical protein
VSVLKGNWALMLDNKLLSRGKLEVPPAKTPPEPGRFGFLAGTESTLQIDCVRYRTPY